MKKVLFILAALIIIGSPVVAFHDGGVAHCNGCHTMHNSQDGDYVDALQPRTATATCLRSTPLPATSASSCHSHVDHVLP